MKYFTVLLLFCCIAVAAAGETVSTLRSYKFTFDAERHVKFMILKHNDLNNPHQLKFNSTINSEWVNDKWKTVVFVHGWIGGHRLSEIMKNAYFSENHANVNLIEVNWLQGAYNLAYFPSAARVSSVGKTIGKFIGLNQGKFKLEEFIIVGHSLGAHAAGFAGKYLQSNYKFTPRLIVGLDPAGPLFFGSNKKLQPNDAQDVLVIHTSQMFGHLKPLGTTDIYINGGKLQPGCSDMQSHGFAKIFYRELVNGKEPLVGHRYSSFAEIETGTIPKTEKLKLFHGVPFPPKGTLIYISTEEQPYLVSEVQKYIGPRNSATTSYCTLM